MTDLTAPVPGNRPSGLTFEQTVPRSLAFRGSIAEVYVADTAPAGPDEYLAAVQTPRAHSVWFDRLAPYHDPLAAVEAVRQAVTVVAQRHFRASQNVPASLQSLEFCVEDLAVFRDDHDSPLEGVVRIRCGQDRDSAAYFRETNFEAVLTVDGAQALSARITGTAFSKEVYEEFRSLQQKRRPATTVSREESAEPVDPSRVGRRDPRNVVIGRPHGNGRELGQAGLAAIVDPTHPYFFDYRYDHVATPFLVEVVRQAAILTATTARVLPSAVAAITGARIDFLGFAELEGEISLTATIGPEAELSGIEISVDLFQFQQHIVHSCVELSPYP